MKAAGEKWLITYKGTPQRLKADFSTETSCSEGSGKTYSKKKNSKRILYSAKLSFKTKGEIKIFPDKQKLTEFGACKLAVQEILKKSVQDESKWTPKVILLHTKKQKTARTDNYVIIKGNITSYFSSSLI